MNAYIEEIYESEQVRIFNKRLHTILDSKYVNTDLNRIIKKKFQNLTETKCNESLERLQKIKELFDGRLGNWKTDPVGF